MTILNDAGPNFESAAKMTNPSPTNAAVGIAPTIQGEDTASTITVNTKAPANNFPPPKTDKPRPHICATCTRSFARLEHLKRHERSHTKEKPFECPECTRCFARRDLLLRHQQKLHQTTTPSSRPRNRRESASGATPGQSRARKNSVAGTNAAAAAAASANMRPRANTISHVDGAHMQMMAAANAAASRAPQTHSRHASLIGMPLHNMEHVYNGMSAALGQRGLAHGLPKLETHYPMDYPGGLRTAPPMAHFNQPGFEYDMFFSPGNTINPNALHYSDSPHSMGLDSTSPYSLGFPDMSGAHHVDDGNYDFLSGFEQSMVLNNGNEHAVDGSSPSAISTTSQSGMSDVMVDGSNQNATTAAGTTSIWQPSLMAPPQMPNQLPIDMNGTVFPDLFNNAPLSPAPHQQKNTQQQDAYFTPPHSMSSMSPGVMSSLNAHNMNQALYGAGPDTPTSMNGINHGTSLVSTITDSTRNAILDALSSAASQISAFAVRKPSFTMQSSPLSPHGAVPDHANSLPGTLDLQRFVAAYIRFFHPHLPFIHIPTLSFEIPVQSANNRTNTVGGPTCLLLSMAAMGALYELEHDRSRGLFDMAKKMIQTYLEQRRRANVKKAGFRGTGSEQGTEPDNSVDTPVWLVQSMLLNVVYGHNCGDKRAGEIASTHCAALSSLAQGAGLLRPTTVAGTGDQDVDMGGTDGAWTGGMKSESDEQAEWLRWKTLEERKRTLYSVLILSSLLVSAYNHAPTLTNSEILLDLPCDEEFFSAESSTSFHAKGGIAAAGHNRVTFHDALGELLRTNEKQQKLALSNGSHPFGSSVNTHELPPTDLKPSAFGCLILINALHNYIWETRQRHHNKVWTNEESEKMHRHIEPALKAWQAAWASNPHHSLERPNPFGMGPLSADAIPLLDLAYVRLFVNLARSKDKFWQRDWDGMAEELSRGSEIIQHAEQSPVSTSESAVTDPSESPANNSVFVDSPITQNSSPDFAMSRMSLSASQQQSQAQLSSRSTSRREKHLRKAAFYAADSLSMADKLGVTFADFTSRELPLQSAMCAFDCAQVLAEWVATLQDRVGRYLGILGRDEVDLAQVPAIILLEEEDVKLLGKVQEVLTGAEMKMSMETVSGVAEMDPRVQMGELTGYAAKILRVTAYMLNKAGVWPVTHLMAQCLETHANHMKARAERSVMASEQAIMI